MKAASLSGELLINFSASDVPTEPNPTNRQIIYFDNGHRHVVVLTIRWEGPVIKFILAMRNGQPWSEPYPAKKTFTVLAASMVNNSWTAVFDWSDNLFSLLISGIGPDRELSVWVPFEPDCKVTLGSHDTAAESGWWPGVELFANLSK
jgi:hypothetical protein